MVLKNNPLYKVLPIVTMGIPPTGLLAAIFLLGEKPELLFLIVGVILMYLQKIKIMRLKNENRIYWFRKCWR